MTKVSSAPGTCYCGRADDRSKPTHTSPSAPSEAARRPARTLQVPHLRSCRSWPPAVGHKRVLTSGSFGACVVHSVVGSIG